MKGTRKILRLILGDQLDLSHPWFGQVRSDVTYLLMEVGSETQYVLHHIQKVCAFFAAMRAFAATLRRLGHRVVYIPLDEGDNRQTFGDNIARQIRKNKFGRFEYILPDEMRVDRILQDLTERLSIPVNVVDSEHFFTRRDELAAFFKGKKRFLMEPFYRDLRKRHDLLVDQEKPHGGRWNFDRENRRPYDGKIPVPAFNGFGNDVTDIVAMLDRMKVKTFGEISPSNLIWPITRDQALHRLECFVHENLPYFGTYQDAMSEIHPALFHSRLSFPLNTKMLNPLEVVRYAVNARIQHPRRYSIQQVEGFVRQILGWREYMRGVYWACMPGLSDENFFSHHRPLPDFYWTGKTHMHCMKTVIGQSLKYAWAHHIQRLMITGSFALLAGVQPSAVDAWYLGVYVDALEWVELPNTRGMSQFADGGKIATKPYVSTANYIRRMSDYCRNCRYEALKRHGDRACPFNSLYWDFYHRHRDRLNRHPRIGMIYRTWDAMRGRERENTLTQAKYYKVHLNIL